MEIKGGARAKMAYLLQFITFKGFTLLKLNIPCGRNQLNVFHIFCLNLFCMLLITSSQTRSVVTAGYCGVCSCYKISPAVTYKIWSQIAQLMKLKDLFHFVI